MIGCDSCDSWFHWSCVGIVVEPRKEDVWICSDCRRVKPLKKKKKDFASSKESYTPTASSTRPSSGVKKGPKVKTGSGLPFSSSSSSSSIKKSLPSQSSSSSSSSSVVKSSVHTTSSSTLETMHPASSSQQWMCTSCKTW